MLGIYTYHEIIKKTVTAFGTLFNNIEIQRKSATRTEVLKVPLAYGPRQKFLSRLKAVGDLTKKDQVQITLPRIYFEINGIQYDATRKLAPTQTIRNTTPSGGDVRAFMPVPYNINFELGILSKNQDDALQILEQILPYFQPNFNITMNLLSEIGEKRDFPVTLNSIDYQDEYQGDFDTRRTLIYVLQFTTKSYLYGPVTDTSDSVIKKAIVDMATKLDVNAPREVRYTVTPDPITADADDNFGFNEIYSEYSDAKVRNPVTGQDQ